MPVEAAAVFVALVPLVPEAQAEAEMVHLQH
jgi:hypothetical protein